MDEIKRKVLERHYIRDNYYFHESSYDEYIKELRESGNEDEYKKVNRYEYDKERTSKWIRRYGSKDNAKDILIYFGWGTVIADLQTHVASCSDGLKAARELANQAFSQYMNYKNLIKEGTLKWSDMVVRERMKVLKQSWVDASNEVQKRKSMLWQASLISSRFISWYIATNDKIQKLENEIKELKGEES